MIAAIAVCGGMGVLYRDAADDVIHENTGLDFHSEWLMPRGSME